MNMIAAPRCRIVAVLGLALCLLGCGGGAVRLVTDNGHPPMPGCYTNWAEGPLVVDPIAGTAIIDNDLHATTPVPVIWRVGFTARQHGSEIEVLDPTGNIVALTGRSYRIDGGYASIDGVSGFWACNRVTALP